MSTTEHERFQILQWFEEQMGSEKAAIMMKLVAPVGWGDIVTRQDLRAETAVLRGEMAELRSDLRGEMADLRGEFGELRGEFGELRGEFGELRGEVAGIKGQIVGLKGELARSLITWLLASQATLVGLVLAVARLG